MTAGTERLYEEIAALAHLFGWPLDDLLDLEHGVRRRFLREAERLAAAAGAR